LCVFFYTHGVIFLSSIMKPEQLWAARLAMSRRRVCRGSPPRSRWVFFCRCFRCWRGGLYRPAPPLPQTQEHRSRARENNFKLPPAGIMKLEVFSAPVACCVTILLVCRGCCATLCCGCAAGTKRGCISQEKHPGDWAGIMNPEVCFSWRAARARRPPQAGGRPFLLVMLSSFVPRRRTPRPAPAPVQ
jgi:hypothetical protein